MIIIPTWVGHRYVGYNSNMCCVFIVSCIIMQAVKKDGTDRVKTECDRGGQTWRPRKVMEPKNTEWMDEIAKTVLQVGFW